MKGGVLIYAKEGINYIPRNALNIYSSKEIESQFLEVIEQNGTNTIIGVIYRHPCIAPSIFNDVYLRGLLLKLSAENKRLFIAGDYNMDLIKTDNHEGTFDFLELMTTNFLLPTITIPTRINSVNNTLIDNIFSSEINPDLKSGNLMVGISDHLPSFMIIPKRNQQHLPKNHNLYKRNLKNFDKENFILEYLNINWEDELKLGRNDTNYSMEKFLERINNLIDKYIPLKKLTQKEFKRRHKPWINDEIINKIKIKNKSFKKYVKSSDIIKKSRLKSEYNILKNEITLLTRNSKKGTTKAISQRTRKI